MSDVETTGKEQPDDFTLTPIHESGLVKRSKPTLVQLGNRLVPSDGRWHPDLVAEYVRDHGGRSRWIPTGELARVFYGGNTPSNKERVRRRLFRVWHSLLNQQLLLVIEVSVRTAAQACKIYDARSVEERQYLHERLARMEKQKLLKAEQVHKAIALAECLDALNSETG